MSCNCKKKLVKDEVTGKMVETVVKNGIITSSIQFLLSVIIVPFLYPLIVVMLFKHFFIGGNVDIVKMLSGFKKLEKVEKEEEIDLATINPDDYEMVGVDIIEKVKDE